MESVFWRLELPGKEEASDIQISDADFYRNHDIAFHRSFSVGKVDLRRTYRGQRLRYLLSATTKEFAAHPCTDQARKASRGDWIRLYWKGY